ncbi:hypothetical protein U9M48_014822 [Paspalum notatum var. saurae]|uniref:FHA domain-containing protein n=1 Tax=Paspalum notatum var. saurae TaxID=547442 RepID=A0AAQ3WL83_PASNO
MATPNSTATPVCFGNKVPGFAKLQGENFEYFMQTYSIILGRNTKDSTVHLDLSEYGGKKRVSRCHARIFYDFEHHHFALEVLGRYGCSIQGVSYLPGSDPVKLNSQDLIEIAGKKIYFLLPTRSMFNTYTSLAPQSTSSMPSNCSGNPCADDYGCGNCENGVKVSTNVQTKLVDVVSYSNGINSDPVGVLGGCVNQLKILNADKDTDNQQLRTRADKDEDTEDQQILLEEKDVVSCIATLISDLCSPGDWLSMMKLHSELVVVVAASGNNFQLLERFGESWPRDRVRRYLTQKDDPGSSSEAKGRPWCSLLPLFKKYPDHFVMSTVTRGQSTSEFVGLVPLLPLENDA